MDGIVAVIFQRPLSIGFVFPAPLCTEGGTADAAGASAGARDANAPPGVQSASCEPRRLAAHSPRLLQKERSILAAN